MRASVATRQLPIYCVERDQKVCSISFDAAWGADNTQKILDVLADYGVKATFFVVGNWADQYPEQAKAIVDSSCELMNHSNAHDHYNSLTAEQIIKDVNTCNDKFEALTGARPTLIRCPFGEYDDHVISAIRSIGMEPIQWDVERYHTAQAPAGLAFGSLTGSGASGAVGQPILNDNAAITENMNQAAFAINQILGEGIENVQERIANDFAGTGGDHYEVVNPYEGDHISNANLFISQYCAAKELDFDSISLTDMEQILRAGLSHLYSFSRTMEVRTVPAEEDGEEDTAETWYIYTIRYNGEAYFAGTIFALTDEQKGLAENYAENLSLFLGDGLFQYAPSTNTITALGDVRFTDGETEVIYFNQLDERYVNQPYGTDHIGGYGCGPTSMAIVVSSLTSETVDPVQMARWAYEHGYWCSKSGSYHTLIPGAAQA